jgi:hypothetical protein
LRNIAVALIAVAGGSTAYALTSGGGRSGTGVGGSPAKYGSPPAATSRSPSISHETAVSISQGIPTVVLSAGVLNKSTVWAENCQGVYLSTDEGVKWRNITPRTIDYGIDTVCNRSEGIFSNGTQLFMFVFEVGGLGETHAPGSGGSSRGDGLEISSNNGQSWILVQPPGCNAGPCGPFGLLPNGDLFELADNTLYESSDLGSAWTPIQRASASSTFGAVEYVSPQDAWEITANYGNGDVGQLYRSTDGGARWANASPGTNSASLTYDLPTFFGHGHGVMLAYPRSALVPFAPIVFTTANGGQTWQPHTVPGNNPGGSFQPQLSAVSASNWLVADGGGLYETANAGVSWTVISKGLPWSTNGVLTLDFSSSDIGYVVPVNGLSSTISLWATTTRGRRWVNENPGAGS